MNRTSSKGFTLVEIIVIVIVLGILLSIVSVFFNTVQVQARDTKRFNDIETLSVLLEKYFQRNGTYPTGCGGNTCSSSSFISFQGAATDTISVNTTPASVATILGQSPLDIKDPKLTASQPPFMGEYYVISNTTPGYIYRGGQSLNPSFMGTGSVGVIMLTEQGSSRECRLTLTFDSANRGISNGDMGSFVLAYYSEYAKSWQIRFGNRGVKPTIDAGASPNFCNITQ